MNIVILYHPASDHGRIVEEYSHELLGRYKDIPIELMSVDTREGAEKARVYDVVQYPAILAFRSDGSVIQQWVGLPLPLMNEVIYYARS